MRARAGALRRAKAARRGRRAGGGVSVIKAGRRAFAFAAAEGASASLRSRGPSPRAPSYLKRAVPSPCPETPSGGVAPRPGA